MATGNSHLEENLRLIEKAYPVGKIYTIYSLNLRYLFELDEESRLKEEIRGFKLKSLIVTWLKARYLQKEFESESERSDLIHEEFEDCEVEAQSNIEIGFYKKFEEGVKTQINERGEIFYFLIKKSRENYSENLLKDYSGCGLTENSKKSNDKDQTLFEILCRLKNDLKDIYHNNEIKDKQSFGNDKITCASDEINLLINRINIENQIFFDDGKLNSEKLDLKKALESLDDLHAAINKKIQEKQSSLYKEIRRAEKFLASDQFAKFTEDPFFRISKDIGDDRHRIIEIGGKKRKLINATNEEKKIINNGHEFSIFRGHLKDNWLNSLTYKIFNGADTTYFIRLSRDGLLQIRKEEVLKDDCILIDVLTGLLEAQKKYSTEQKQDIKDDILEVAVGFAKLLEFRTVSNFVEEFAPRTIRPVNVNDARAKYKNLEREKYTVLFLTEIKRNKTSGFAFSPTDLEKNFPSAISCMLQGSLEKPERDVNIKLYQAHYSISASGKLDSETLRKMRIKIKDEQKKLIAQKGFLSDGDLTDAQRKNLWIELKGYYVIPRIGNPAVKDYVDLSTWNKELCIFKPERGLIFFNGKETLESGNRDVPYEDYWICIVRGIEYTVALRATLQIFESRTTRLLDKIPEILSISTNNEKNGLGESKETDKAKIAEQKEKDFKEARKRVREMAEDLASIFKVLPSLRSIAIPTRAFRSGHSVRKFEYLYNECFNFEETFENIQKNIDELTSFLTFFERQHLQQTIQEENIQRETANQKLEETIRKANEESTKVDKKLNLTALAFTITSIIYVSTSFMQDTYEFIGTKNYADGELSIAKIIYFSIYILIFVVIWLIIWGIDPDYGFKSVFKQFAKLMEKSRTVKVYSSNADNNMPSEIILSGNVRSFSKLYKKLDKFLGFKDEKTEIETFTKVKTSPDKKILKKIVFSKNNSQQLMNTKIEGDDLKIEGTDAHLKYFADEIEKVKSGQITQSEHRRSNNLISSDSVPLIITSEE